MEPNRRITEEQPPSEFPARTDETSQHGSESACGNATAVKEALRSGSTEPLSAAQMCAVLRDTRMGVEKEHRAITKAWRSPLSLFGSEEEQAWQ